MNQYPSLSGIENALNERLKDFKFNFKTATDKSALQIEQFPEIFFPNSAGGSVSGGSFSWINQKHRNGAIHEPAMIAALVALSEFRRTQSTVFFDIGALYGYFSLIGQSVFSSASICAFEMNPLSFAALQVNLKANNQCGNNRVQGFGIGLSDRTFLQHKSKIDGFRLSENNVEEDAVSLDIMKLDDFCNSHNIYPDIMKIDVEGYQAKIIPGAMELITKFKPAILLEFDNGQFMMDKFECTNKSVVKPLFELGYSLLWCADQRGRSSRFEVVSYDELSIVHEKNSLAVFVCV
jgi:FkbM family methyltransferase